MKLAIDFGLPFEPLLGTKQRISNVLNIKRSDFDGEAISVCQDKTMANLWIPASQPLPQRPAQLGVRDDQPGVGRTTYTPCAYCDSRVSSHWAG